MSVSYKSDLIYGFELNPSDWKQEEIEHLEDTIGWDVIRDGYSDQFLYIGKIISSTACYDEARVDCLREMPRAISDCNDLIVQTPNTFVKRFPCDASMYHLCYAT